MCTVTIVPLGDSGFRLVCNRDERLPRPAAIPPSWRCLGRSTAAFPVDPAGGGTWVGVNDAGVAMALLNRTTRGTRRRPGGGRSALSRGLVIPALLDCRSMNEALEAAQSTDYSAFDAFSLVIVAEHHVAELTNASGPASLRERTLHQPVLFTSSSLGDERVEGPRRRLFEALVKNDGAGWTLGQVRFHRTQWAARPDISVLMERPDARTVSRTVIDVHARGTRLDYEELPWRGHRARQAA